MGGLRLSRGAVYGQCKRPGFFVGGLVLVSFSLKACGIDIDFLLSVFFPSFR